jgi:hypothetical protein
MTQSGNDENQIPARLPTLPDDTILRFSPLRPLDAFLDVASECEGSPRRDRRTREQGMFSSVQRAEVCARVLALGRADARVSGGAVTGSCATNAQDSWSDVDTAFGYSAGTDPEEVLRDWTVSLDEELDIAHYFDLRQGETAYRVFLLSSGLEVDVSLTPNEAFGPHGPAFRLVFGRCTEGVAPTPESPDELIGWGWISLFGARAAIERSRWWQAVRFIGAVRDHGLALACLRHGLPSR